MSHPPISLSQHTAGRSGGGQAFSLFELLIVMSILAILVTLVIGLGRYADTMAKRHKAVAELGQWHEALHRYYLFHNWGEYPVLPPGITAVSNLLTFIDCDASETLTNRFSDHLTTANIHCLDPWGNAYQYVLGSPTNAPQDYDLYSNGPDRTTPTSDDIRFQ